MTDNPWRTSDPRVALMLRKRAAIVILRPGPTGALEAGTGQVEVHQGWSILTSFKDRPLVDESDKWEPAWQWVIAPV